jgi:flagella basal body P-ring formation protein FlgA
MIDLWILFALTIPLGPSGGGVSGISWPAPAQRIQTLLENALRRRMGPRAAVRIELLEASKRAIWGDAIEFPEGAISKVGAQEYVWRGRVLVYAERRTQPIWVRARITALGSVWIAARDIGAGTELGASDVRQELQQFPLTGPPPLSTEQNPAGRVVRTRLSAGAVIAATMLAAAPAARRGERVTVRVDRGLARLQFEAEVTATAMAGQSVQLKNPWNGRRFQGRVDGPGRVTVPAAQLEER